VKIRRTYQRAYRDLLGAVGLDSTPEVMADALQGQVIVDDARHLVGPTVHHYGARSGVVAALAANSSVLAYQAPDDGAIVHAFLSLTGAGYKFGTFDSGDFPGLAAAGTVEGSDQTGLARGTFVSGHSTNALFQTRGAEINGLMCPFWLPVEPGRFIYVTGTAVNTAISLGFVFQEFPSDVSA